MEPFDRTEPVRVYGERSKPDVSSVFQKRKKRVRTPATYRLCDIATEVLLYFLVVFTPWSFGTTQPWSIWTLNIAGYNLGALLFAKWFIRWKTGYRPGRWGDPAESDGIVVEETGHKRVRWFTRSLAMLTGVTLAYCLISALNPRAEFLMSELRFQYHDYIPWLPHSYDQGSTWNIFWSYLALACFFWAGRDWLLAKTRSERRDADRDEPEHEPRQEDGALPVRLRRLLWVLCINGAVLSLEGILQRLDGTGKLLWLVQPKINQSAEAQFGPYAYRSNAAAYLNLVWPVALGFWLTLRKAALRRHRIGMRVGGGSYVVLLPCAVIMAGAPIISTSRGGALVALGLLVWCSLIVFFASRRERPWVRASMLSVFIVILSFAAYLGWKQLADRLENMFVDDMSNRTEIYRNAQPIARDFPVFGTGPGSFGAIYYLYRDQKQVWEAYLHDDWLETRITFGRVGVSLVLAMFALVLMRWCAGPGIGVEWDFVGLLMLSLVGCLIHAKYDFPFQVHSILLLFLLLCSILFCLGRVRHR